MSSLTSGPPSDALEMKTTSLRRTKGTCRPSGRWSLVSSSATVEDAAVPRIDGVGLKVVGGDSSPVEARVVSALRVGQLDRKVWAIGVLKTRLGWSLTRISREAGKNDDWAAGLLSRYRKSVDRNRGLSARSKERGLLDADELIRAASEQACQDPNRCAPIRTTSPRPKARTRTHTRDPKGVLNGN